MSLKNRKKNLRNPLPTDWHRKGRFVYASNVSIMGSPNDGQHLQSNLCSSLYQSFQAHHGKHAPSLATAAHSRGGGGEHEACSAQQELGYIQGHFDWRRGRARIKAGTLRLPNGHAIAPGPGLPVHIKSFIFSQASAVRKQTPNPALHIPRCGSILESRTLS